MMPGVYGAVAAGLLVGVYHVSESKWRARLRGGDRAEPSGTAEMHELNDAAKAAADLE